MFCQLCETSEADILCESCKRLFVYCKDCFAFSHKNDTLCAHKIKSIVNTTRQTLIDLGYICKYHTDERYSLVCKTCEISVCSECSIKGQHKTHEVVPTSEFLKKLKEGQVKKMVEGDVPYDEIAKCIAFIEEGYGMRKSYVNEMTETIDILFRGALAELAREKSIATKKFDQIEEEIMRKKHNLIEQAGKMMSHIDSVILSGNKLKVELEGIVKEWRDKYEEAEIKIQKLEDITYIRNEINIAEYDQNIDFDYYRSRFNEICAKCVSLKRDIEKKCIDGCLLSKVCEKMHSIEHEGIPYLLSDITWNTISNLAFSNCLNWHCYLTTHKLPSTFCAILRLNKISATVGDWTHVIGLTEDKILKSKIREADYEILFNKNYWALSPNFDSVAQEAKNGDFLKISLNSKKELRIQFNLLPEVVAYQSVKGSFYLFCSLYGRNQEIELLSISEI